MPPKPQPPSAVHKPSNGPEFPVLIGLPRRILNSWEQGNSGNMPMYIGCRIADLGGNLCSLSARIAQRAPTEGVAIPSSAAMMSVGTSCSMFLSGPKEQDLREPTPRPSNALGARRLLGYGS